MKAHHMRIDMLHSAKRPWYLRLLLAVAKLRVGTYPGPPLTISYNPELFDKQLVGYIMRGMRGSSGWTKGEAEMFAAFVSHLNACKF